MQWIADYKSKVITALIVFAGIALAANHFTEWSGEKIKSTCQEDADATAVAANRDIVEKRVIPERNTRPTLTIWKCPDGKMRTTASGR